MMVVYELQLFRDHDWKIDSVFDDRDLAVIEAQRIERSKRYSGVRVVEETCDQSTSRPVTRTIYRSSKVETPHPGASSNRSPSASQAVASLPRQATNAATAKHSGGNRRFLLVTALTIGAIVVCGLGAFYVFSELNR